MPATPHRIDVHHHLAPPSWMAKMIPQNPIRKWTVEKSIEDMDNAGVATSILSITTPGVWFGDAEEARRIARESNDYAAKLVADYPGRFGMFAVLPLPDIDASQREIEYAMDTLEADGIGLLTNYDTKWLGDPFFAPIFDELNRRKLVVYTHPTTASCCTNLVPNVPDAMIEYGTDTSRTVASLIFSGAAIRYPDIRLIFSHAGGTVPFLVERFLFQAKQPQSAPHVPNGVLHELKRFYYDTAQAFQPGNMAALTKIAEVSQILFGTDFPYRTAAEHVAGLRECGFSAAELQAIDRDNALTLLPRFR
jgi:predicted TIM-barrel fold metal-dependent hydrolase